MIALFVVTVIWGGTFVWMKQGLEASAAALGTQHTTVGIALFMGLRFGLSALLLAVCVPSSRRGLSPGAWRGGFWLGGLLFAGFVLQMFGLEEVTPAVSAFLTSLYVLFTALIIAFVNRRGLGPALALGVVLATCGAGFIRGRPELAFSLAELLTVGCALVFALHILATDRITRRVRSPARDLELVRRRRAGEPRFVRRGISPVIPRRRPRCSPWSSAPAFLVPLALSTLLATVLALSLMNLYQRELDPVRAAILYAIEPIWAALFALALGMAQARPLAVDRRRPLARGEPRRGARTGAVVAQERRARAPPRPTAGDGPTETSSFGPAPPAAKTRVLPSAAVTTRSDGW